MIHAQPKASHTEFAGRHGDALKVRIAAQPAEGAANEELRRFLAELQVQADSTAPTGIASGMRSLRAARARSLVKKVKERDQQKAESRNKRGRDQSSAQRARGQRESLR